MKTGQRCFTNYLMESGLMMTAKNSKNTDKPANNRKSTGKFKAGKSGNPKGREKGTKNKFTTLKADFLDVHKKLGGVEGLHRWAADPRRPGNMGRFYQILATLLPRSVNLSVEEHALKLAEAIKEKDPKLYEKVVAIMNEMDDE